ncbi:MAG: hypothetical protein AAFP77_16285 [Bacteroidota bacterium]
MKTFFTLPSDSGFFNRYATLTPTLYRVGFLAQIVSALTEVGIIYSIIFSSLVQMWPAYAATVATVGAGVGATFIEVGLRKFTPYSVRAILYRRFTGLDLAMSVFILAACVGLLFTSGALSFGGSKDLVENVAPEPEQQTTVAADSIAQAARADVLATYRADSLEIVQRYQVQAEALRVATASQIDVQRAQLRKYYNLERNTGKGYGTKKRSIRAAIEQLEADRDTKAAELEQAKAGELSAILQERKGSLSAIGEEYAAQRDSVQHFNASARADLDRKVSAYGGGLAWFTVICLAVFVLSVVLHEIHRKGSGIEERILPTQYDFSDTVMNAALHALGNRYQQLVRSGIRNFEEGTAAPPLPAGVSELYNLGELQQPVYEVSFEELPASQRSVLLNARPPIQSTAGGAGSMSPEDAEKRILEYLAAAEKLEGENFHHLAEELQLKANQVLKMYLGSGATAEAVAELRKGCLEYLANKGPNPFAHHHRQRIGFKTATQEQGGKACVSNATVSNEAKSGGGSKMAAKDCLHCGTSYQPKVAWQKYCSTSCKEEFHAQKHGGNRFDPKAYKRTRK